MVNTKAWKTDLKQPKHPLLMVHCFRCNKEFGIKWNNARKAYSLKNSWAYWTGETEGDKKICDNCLIHFYRNEKALFWEKVSDPKRRDIMNAYLNSGRLVAS